MKNMEKRKIVRFVIFALCVVIFVSIFLILRSWFHSDGMHFIGGYGQVHMSQICEGIDQDGNKIESRNVIVDGVITTGNRSYGKFSGEIDIDDLPELNEFFAAIGSAVTKGDNGLYCLGICLFIKGPIYKKSDDEGLESNSAVVWIKDNQVAMEFHEGSIHSEKYYIFYSDKEMLNIEEIRARLLDLAK